DREDAPETMVLSHQLWMSRFGSDPAIIGRALSTDRGKVTVIGVMPAQFYFPTREVNYWVPMRLSAREFQARDDHYLSAIGKLRPGVSIDQARAEMAAIGEQLERQYPVDNRKAGVGVSTLRDELSPRSRQLLFALVGASLGVLLIACTNLANLLLARALVRRK